MSSYLAIESGEDFSRRKERAEKRPHKMRPLENLRKYPVSITSWLHTLWPLSQGTSI